MNIKNLLVSLLFLSLSLQAFSQQVNGTILSDSANLTVVKVWGTHYERGFAYGYLCGDKILDMYYNYYLANFGAYMTLAHDAVASGAVFKIDSAFFDEAKGVLAGMDSAGFDTDDIDHISLIVGNCLLELLNMMKCKGDAGMGCSSLMSWGAATLGTDLNGRSVITRHLDWNNDIALLRNQMMVIHIPSESDEQAWISIGFAGQISALSGVNAHFGTFQHMMSDFSGAPSIGTLYEPIWFCLRRALEKSDLNGDGFHDTKDVRDALLQSSSGTGDGYIISTLAKSTAGSCALIAEVAETAPAVPYYVFRSNDFADSIPSDNLYAANYEIKRNNHYHFCTRYHNVIAALGGGMGIGTQENWDIMRDSSVAIQAMSNIQMMQYIPEDGIIKLSVQKNGKPAFMNPPDVYLLANLFTSPAQVSILPLAITMSLYPNPGRGMVNLSFYNSQNGPYTVSVYNLAGTQLLQLKTGDLKAGNRKVSVDVSSLQAGVYILQLQNQEVNCTGKFVITN